MRAPTPNTTQPQFSPIPTDASNLNFIPYISPQIHNKKMSCRHKTVIQSSNIPQYKLSITTKSLIWYKAPVSQFSTARITLFGRSVNLGFGNQGLGTREVEFQIEDSFQLAGFYEKPILMEIVNGNDGKDGGQVVGYCQLDPRTISQKSIIAPILSSCCSCAKLGDIEIQFKLTKSATDICQLREINRSLDQMINKCPNHFDNLYCRLRSQGHICGRNCCNSCC